MYRLSKPEISMGGGAVITTHCEDGSSNTVVGDRVFANFNSSTKSLSTKGLLAHRNNDYMKFSWDPMQVSLQATNVYSTDPLEKKFILYIRCRFFPKV